MVVGGGWFFGFLVFFLLVVVVCCCWLLLVVCFFACGCLLLWFVVCCFGLLSVLLLFVFWLFVCFFVCCLWFVLLCCVLFGCWCLFVGSVVWLLAVLLVAWVFVVMKGWALATSPGQGQGTKRTRLNGGSGKASQSSLESSIISDVARLSLRTADVVRNLQGVCTRTFLVSEANKYAQSALEAGRSYSQLEKGAKKFPPYVFVAAALILVLSTDELAGPDSRACAAQVGTEAANPSDLLSLFSCCRISRCFDKIHCKIEFAATPQQATNPVFQHLAQGLLVNGATELFGPPPRGPLERNVQQHVDAMKSK